MKKKHTGKIHHPDHVMHLESISGRDPHAHPSHHEMNKKHGTPKGFAPKDGDKEDDVGEPGGEGMAENEE